MIDEGRKEKTEMRRCKRREYIGTYLRTKK